MTASPMATIYIPEDRLQAMVTHQDLPEQTEGAALFADISGFTKLTEGLARSLGIRRGAEELTVHLNQVYDAVISEVVNYRGSVLGFSGDAITCWYEGSLDDAARRAVSSGIRIQEQMKQFAEVTLPDGETTELTIKVSVACGTARRFLIGNPDIQLVDALAGETIFRVADAGEVTEKGEVVVDKATLDALGMDLQTVTWREGVQPDQQFAVLELSKLYVEPDPWQTVNMEELDEDAVARWVLPIVYNRIQNNFGEFLTELRPAGALFVRFDGIDYENDDDCGAKLNEFVSGIQKIVDGYEGSLIQVTIGDKGSYLYSAFGAPIAHENDVERSVLSARDIIKLSQQYDYIRDIQIGVSYGTMRTGSYGGSTRRTYGSLGNQVNIAARLMKAAGYGEVIATQHVYETTKDKINWDILHPIRVKGISDPLPVFRLQQDSARSTIHLREPSHYAPMFGRVDEQSTVQEKIALVRQGKGQVISIVGEAGIGKSRLLAEIIHSAQAEGIEIYAGACESYGVNISYLVWQNIWRSIFHVTDDESLDDLRQQLEAIQPAYVDRLPLLSSVLDIPIPDNDFTSSLEPELRKSALEGLLLDVLRTRSRQAQDQVLMIVLEDSHWIDPASRDLLNLISRVCPDWSLLLVIVHRPFDATTPSERYEFESHAHSTVITLGALEPLDADRLIRDRLDQVAEDEVPEPLIERIAAQSEGNPFFIEELINYLDVMGVSFDKLDVTTLELPSSMHNLVLSRIDQIREREKVVLKVASIIGRMFRVDWLQGYYPTLGDKPQIHRDLNEIEKKDLIVFDQPEPDLAYLFKHIVTQEAAYNSLPFAQRTDLHERLGDYLEVQDPQRYVDLLAYHFEHSANADKSLKYLHLAGDAAVERFANEEAISYFTRALKYVPEPDLSRRYNLIQSRENVFELRGERDHQREDIEHMESLANQLNDSSLQAYVALRWSIYHRKQGDLEASIKACEQGISIAEDHQLDESRRQLLLEWGITLWRKSEFEDAKTILQRVLDLSADHPHMKALSLRNLGVVENRQGNFAEAHKRFEACYDLFQQLDNKRDTGRALQDLAMTSYQTGNLPDATLYLEQSLQIWRQIGERYEESNALGILGLIVERDNPQQAKAYLRNALTIKQEINDKHHEVYVMVNLGNVIISEANYEEALTTFQQAMTLGHDVGDSYIEAIAAVNAGLVSRHLGDYQNGLTYIRQTQSLAGENNDRWTETYAQMETGWNYIYRGQYEIGYENAVKAQAIFEELGDTSTCAHAKICAVEALRQMERYDEALTLCQQAHTTYTDGGQITSRIESLAYLAYLQYKLGQTTPALEGVHQVLAHLEEQSYHGLDEPINVYLMVCQVIEACDNSRLIEVTQQAKSVLNEITACITDETLKQSFIENVTYNQQLLAL